MRRNTWIGLAIVVAALVLCVVVALGIFAIGRSGKNNIAQAGVTPPLPQAQTTLGAAGGKPQPVVDYYQGCPPVGDGGDPALNTLKNRLDESTWQPTTVANLLALTWPPAIEQKPRAKWSAADAQAIAKYEGTPVQAEGYLLNVQKQGPESCNCHSVDQVDFHIWLADDPNKNRTQSVVIEMSPRVRSYHPAWTLANLRNVVKNKQKVRISGWLMMDPEHPDQIGKTRGTIWEIHPIMQVETQQNGNWVPLDNGTTGMHSGSTTAQALPTPAAGSTPTTPASATQGRQNNSDVKITNVNYDGKKGSAEPDEYVEIKNTGSRPVDITSWVLQNASDRDQFTWDNEVLQPGQVIDVYTNEVHQDSGGFSFGSSHAVWANSGGVAELYDADKVPVSRYAYGNQK
jgi:hypothetical protein